jgi:hypothetical protein
MKHPRFQIALAIGAGPSRMMEIRASIPRGQIQIIFAPKIWSDFSRALAPGHAGYSDAKRLIERNCVIGCSLVSTRAGINDGLNLKKFREF